MTGCGEWLADDFLVRNGFAITDPGNGMPRVAARRGITFPLDPKCRCVHCSALSESPVVPSDS